MGTKNIKYGKSANIALIIGVIIQVFLLLNSAIAESYMINEIDNSDGQKIIDIQKIKNVFNKGTKFLFSFLSIKQIGIVSAAPACCEKKTSGGHCIDADSSECDSAYSSSPNQCNSPGGFCESGYCFDPQEGTCYSGAPKAKCISEGGEWTREFNEKCQKGCCKMDINTDYVTETACKNIAQDMGYGNSYVFDDTPEQQCRFYSEDEGACIYDGGCNFVTEKYCLETLEGSDFKKGMFCSDPSLNTKYKAKFTKKCVENSEDVYWYDDHDNKEGIAQDCKVRESVCDESSGTAVCKSLSCIDNNNKKRVNGESWCEYGGYVGGGKDLVGSSHYRLSCKDGKIEKPFQCGGDYRTEICAEKIVDGISKAQCRPNLGALCFQIDNQAECEDPSGNPDCMWDSVNVDTYFKFDVCLPKYNEGFESLDQAQQVCSIGTQTCTMVEEKQFLGHWDCKKNCECGKKKFVEEMNNFCTSLGDCGSKVNYLGVGTENYKVTGKSYMAWEVTCNAVNYCGGLECKKSSNCIPGYKCEAVNDSFNKNQVLYYMNCKGSTAKSPTILNMFYGQCKNYGKCVNGVYEITDKPRSKDFLQFINKTNQIGVNTPEFLTTSEDAGTYGDEFNPQGDVENNFDINHVWNFILPTMGIVIGAIGGAVIGGTIGSNLVTYAVLGLTIGPIGAVIGLVVGAILGGLLFSLFGTKQRTRDVKFECLPWKAPAGGQYCEQCNNQEFPCTKHKCETLGTACQLDTNTYESENPLCFNPYSNDLTPPLISPGSTKTGLKFVQTTVNGTSIKTTSDQCIRSDVNPTFSLKTDEFADCRWDIYGVDIYDTMSQTFVESGKWSKEHTIENLALPQKLANGSVFRLYVKCIDKAGNPNYKSYTVNICISPIPDFTPPHIIKFQPADNSFLKKGITEVPLKIILNEAAECRWSNIVNTPFTAMNENATSCNNDPDEGDGYISEWNCHTQLTGLTQTDNRVYFKCNDSSGNINPTDIVYNIHQTTQDLIIKSTSPAEGEVIERPITSVDPLYLEVLTEGGMNNGKSDCEYKFVNVGWKDKFTQTNAENHIYQFTSIPQGTYDVEIKCHDVAGNEATKTLHFSLDADIYPPVITNCTNSNTGKCENVGGDLKLTTNEIAVCYYNNERCQKDPENQTAITLGQDTEHWIYGLNSRLDYYVTCQDEWKNRNSKCAIVINATEKNDGQAPDFVRVYNDFGTLKLITDKEARCSYTGNSCDFNVSAGEGKFMTSVNGEYSKEHETEWNQQSTYYIKCEDNWHNQNNGCLIVVKPFDVFTRP